MSSCHGERVSAEGGGTRFNEVPPTTFLWSKKNHFGEFTYCGELNENELHVSPEHFTLIPLTGFYLCVSTPIAKPQREQKYKQM